MRLLAALALLASPAFAQTPPPAGQAPAAPGPVSALATAHRLHAQALATADTTALVQAIRLARGVTIRTAPGWTLDQGAAPPEGEPAGTPAPADPAGPEALAIAIAFAGEDPALQDLVDDLQAQLPPGQRHTVAAATSTLAAGQTDTWRIALFGMSPAELAVIGDGDTPLALRITDAEGTPVCTRAAAPLPAPCAFTPAGNAFFTVTVTNPGDITNTYHLLGN